MVVMRCTAIRISAAGGLAAVRGPPAWRRAAGVRWGVTLPALVQLVGSVFNSCAAEVVRGVRAQTSRDSADPGGGLDCRLSQSARALRGADVGPGRRSRDSGAAQAHKAPGPSAGAVRSTPRICRSAGAEVSTTMCRSEGAGGEGGGEGGGGGGAL